MITATDQLDAYLNERSDLREKRAEFALQAMQTVDELLEKADSKATSDEWASGLTLDELGSLQAARDEADAGESAREDRSRDVREARPTTRSVVLTVEVQVPIDASDDAITEAFAHRVNFGSVDAHVMGISFETP